jgi:hypothetical protein
MNIDRVAALVSSIAVAIVVVAAFLLIGTPDEQRQQRLDDRRVAHLQHLAHAVDAYWENHGTLPGSLADLVDGRRLSSLPTDPVHGEVYDYRATAPASYQLCATFDSASDELGPQDFWNHPVGRQCYDFDAGNRSVPRLHQPPGA